MKRIILIVLLIISMSEAKKPYKYSKYTYIPTNAYEVLPELYDKANAIAPNVDPYYFAALIEHESCICITPTRRCRRCFNPTSRLKTKREEGAGLFQLTRAYRRNGSIRFDIIKTLKRKYSNELSELNWGNVYSRPDLQIIAGLLLWKSNYDNLPKHLDPLVKRRFTDSIFNGGTKFFNRERRSCGLKRGCNPNLWYGNVADSSSGRNKRALYSGKTAWQINRRHVKDVEQRMSKYEKDYYDQYYKYQEYIINSNTAPMYTSKDYKQPY